MSKGKIMLEFTEKEFAAFADMVEHVHATLGTADTDGYVIKEQLNPLRRMLKRNGFDTKKLGFKK